MDPTAEKSYEDQIKKYSVEDLFSIIGSIDKEKFPDRYALVVNRIKEIKSGKLSPEMMSEFGIRQPEYIGLEFDQRIMGIHSAIYYKFGILFGIIFIALELFDTHTGLFESDSLLNPFIWTAIVGYLYFAFCIYSLHVYLARISNGIYSISPKAALLKSIIPFYGVLVWPHKWSKNIFSELSTKDGPNRNLTKYGYAIPVAVGMGRIDGGLSLILVFSFLIKISNTITKEYESNNLKILKPGLTIYKDH